jgi:alkyl hydroperoxide reductase subunit AhpC
MLASWRIRPPDDLGSPATRLQLGDPAPNFVAETTAGQIDFHRWKGGSWALLFSHPADFTPVCTTELAEVARLKPEFERRDTKLIGLSVDPVSAHRRWSADIERIEGIKLNFPLIGDSADSVASLYGMVHPGADASVTVRTVFVIDPANIIRLTIAYPRQTGRNFAETLRAIDALQLSDRHSVWTPVGWRPGQPVIVSPAVDDETARERFGAFDAKRPYLRYVRDPEADGRGGDR